MISVYYTKTKEDRDKDDVTRESDYKKKIVSLNVAPGPQAGEVNFRCEKVGDTRPSCGTDGKLCCGQACADPTKCDNIIESC